MSHYNEFHNIMFKKLTPLFLILVTAGLLMSCSSSNPLLGDTESSIQEGNYEAALASADKFIQQNPQSPLGYYWKGVALGQQAQSLENPEKAQPIYKRMNENFAKAQELGNQMEEPPGELNRISSVKSSLWRVAHSTGADYVTNDSLMQATENPYQVALRYFDNATIIQPDSAISWSAKAQMNANLDNYTEAVQAQEKYIELSDSVEARAYLLLAQYYRQADQPKEAIVILEDAREQFPENTQVVEILADSYTQAGESKKAVAMVRELAKENPEEPRYRLSLGTRIFQSTLPLHKTYDENIDKIFNLSQKLRNASGEEAEKIKQQIQKLKNENQELKKEIISLMEEAIAEVKASLKNQPDEPAAYNTLGYIYQNRASLVFSQRNQLTPDNEQFDKLDKQGKDYLRQAMKNYEKAAELDPDNPSYWRSLFSIYTALGMDEKAKEAEKKASMQ